MRKRYLILIPLSILAALIVALVLYIHSGHFNSFLIQQANTRSGRNISADNDIDIKWRWPVTTIQANNLHIGNFSSGTKPDMFTADKAVVSIDWRYVFRGNLFLPEITLDKPVLILEKDKNGNANWNFSHKAAAETIQPDERGDVPGIGKLTIHDGEVFYKDPKKKTDIDMKVDTVVGEAKAHQNLHFVGTGNYQDHDFKMDLTGGNIFLLKDTDEPYPVHMHVQAGATIADLDGTMKDPVKFKGMDTKLKLSGKDASELFNLIGIALPPTPPYNIAGQLDYADKVWHLNDFKGRMGDSDLSGSVSWDKSKKRPKLTGNFVSKNLRFKDLGGLVGSARAINKTPDASAEIKQKAAQQEASPFVIPDTPLDISRMKAMDADVTFTGEKLISQNLPMDDFYMKVNLDNSLMHISPLRFGTAKGDIKIDLTVNARQEPVKIDGDFFFHRLALKPIFEKFAYKLGLKNVTEGYLGGAAHLKGTGKSLRQMLGTSNGDIGLGMEGGQISNLMIEALGLDVAQGLGLFVERDKPTEIRCMIGDFAVDSGQMNVRHFVLDTADTNITGKGQINLKNEALDLTLYAAPKDTSIVSLNAPLTLKGTLKHPHVQVPAQAVGRGVLAAALAALFPPAALAATIEPGLGKDSNCVKLITETKRDIGVDKKSAVIPKNK